MTLIVAIGCSDGIVMAADSAATDSDSGLKQSTKKLKILGGHPIVYSGSGDVGLLQTLDACLEGFQPSTSMKALRKELKKRVVPELKTSAELHVPYPAPGYHQPPAAILLFAGLTTDGKPWILEIEKDGRDTVYGDEMGYFAAIGSGKPLAQAIFRPHLYEKRELALGKIFSYRVIDDAITLSSQGLAHPIHVCCMRPGDEPHFLNEAEIKSLAETCELWRSLERESVGKLLTQGQSAKPTGVPPIPEASV